MPTTDSARRKRLARRRRKRIIRRITTAVISCLIILCVAFAVYSLVDGIIDREEVTDDNYISDEHGQMDDTAVFNPESEFEQDPPPPEQEQIPTPEPEPEIKMMTVELSKEDIKKGILILVNRQYLYEFPEDAGLIDMYTHKSSAYKFRDTGMMIDPVAGDALNKLLVDFYNRTNNGNVNIISTYRTIDDQKRIYSSKLDYYGGDVVTTEKWVALPGASEHHTGLAVDLGIYTSDGESFDFRGEDEYSWINENCYKYGYIVRYDSEKTDITGIAYEPWHFRYLGLPHSEIISGTDLCYEEYISYLKAYPYDGDHMIFKSENGSKYEVFYLKSTGDITTFELPEGSEYFVSGNNIDGYIVTVTLNENS